VGEAHAVAQRLDEAQLPAAGSRELDLAIHADVEHFGSAEHVHARRLHRGLQVGEEPRIPIGPLAVRRRVRPLQQVGEADLEAVGLQSHARQGSELGDRGLSQLGRHRHVGVEVTLDQRLGPHLEQPHAQGGPIASPRLERRLEAARMREQPLLVQLARDAQEERRLGHLGDVDQPVEPLGVGTRQAALDVGERRLVAEVLQLDDHGVQPDERIMGARGDHERELGLVRAPDGEADLVVALAGRAPFRLVGHRTRVRIVTVLAERLLEPVRQHDDLTVLAQLAPHPFRLGVGDRRTRRLPYEMPSRHAREVDLLLVVAQPDRHRHGTVVGQELGQAVENRRLADPHPAGHDVGPAP
jgi:hypothetical protein